MQDASALQQGYPSVGEPRLRVREGVKALVSSVDGVLLVKEEHADGSPFWTLPGGGIAPHETPLEGLQRELEEELRTRVSVRTPVTDFLYKHRSQPNTISRYTVYACTLASDPRPNPAEGIVAHRWVPPRDPPPETLPQVRYVLAKLDGYVPVREPTPSVQAIIE